MLIPVTAVDTHVPLLVAVRSDLTRRLIAWSAVSIVGGGVLWAVGRRGGHGMAVGIGRQALAWGSVDLAIAAAGHRANRRPVADAGAAAVSLRRLLLLNAGLDVGYLAVAAAMRRRAGLRGDSAGVSLQALALLVLDTWHAWRLRSVGTR